MLSEIDVSASGYASNEMSVDDSEYSIDMFPTKTIRKYSTSTDNLASFPYPIVSQTKSIVIPMLYFVFIIGIAQMVILKLHLEINKTIIINIMENQNAFNIAFNVTLILVIISWITLLYAEYQWSLVPLDTAIDNHDVIHDIKNAKLDLSRIKQELDVSSHNVNKICFDDNQLQTLSKELLRYKEQLAAFHCGYKHKTQQKVFQNYIKCIEKQYEDIMHIIDENQFAILSTVLAQVQTQDSPTIDLEHYSKYLRLFNENTINEFNFYGGYHGMKRNKAGSVEVREYEDLVKTIMDVLDENQYTFINY